VGNSLQCKSRRLLAGNHCQSSCLHPEDSQEAYRRPRCRTLLAYHRGDSGRR
jgi:hypothetical protein